MQARYATTYHADAYPRLSVFPGSLGRARLGLLAVPLDEWSGLGNIHAEDVPLEEVWHRNIELVAKELSRRDGEDLWRRGLASKLC